MAPSTAPDPEKGLVEAIVMVPQAEAPQEVTNGYIKWKEGFFDRQREYIAKLLGRKWTCDNPEHELCVPTVDGRHVELTDKQFEEWVNAICAAKATSAQPPAGLLGTASVSMEAKKGKGKGIREAIALAPSRSVDIKLPALAASASVYQRLQDASYFWPTSGIVRSVGEAGLSIVERAILWKRIRKHNAWVGKWEKQLGKRPAGAPLQFDEDKQEQLYRILEEAVEMCRPCYSTRVNEAAAKIGKKILAWINYAGADPRLDLPDHLAMWFSHVQTCDAPIELVQSFKSDPSAEDLLVELIDVITTTPMRKEDTSITASVVAISIRDLAYSTWTVKQRRLGRSAARHVQLVGQFRPYAEDEISAIRDLAARRMIEPEEEMIKQCRPWDVAIFFLLESVDPEFGKFARGPLGLPMMLRALDQLIKDDFVKEKSDTTLHHFTDILHMIWAISVGKKFLEANEDNAKLLVRAFNVKMPSAWYWSQDRIPPLLNSILAHDSKLVATLAAENAQEPLTRFIASRLPKDSNRTRRRFRELALASAKDVLSKIDQHNNAVSSKA